MSTLELHSSLLTALSLPSCASLLITLLFLCSGCQFGACLLKERPVQYNGLPLLPLSEVSANSCCIPVQHSVWIHLVLPLLLSCQCHGDRLKKCINRICSVLDFKNSDEIVLFLFYHNCALNKCNLCPESIHLFPVCQMCLRASSCTA